MPTVAKLALASSAPHLPQIRASDAEHSAPMQIGIRCTCPCVSVQLVGFNTLNTMGRQELIA